MGEACRSDRGFKAIVIVTLGTEGNRVRTGKVAIGHGGIGVGRLNKGIGALPLNQTQVKSNNSAIRIYDGVEGVISVSFWNGMSVGERYAAHLLRGCEEGGVDGAAHFSIAGDGRMKMIAAVEGICQTGGCSRIAQHGIEIDDGVEDP